jgi:hypothetical protein
MKYTLLFIAGLLAANTVSAQRGWQQHIAVKLDVRLDDKTNFLHGYEEITYINSSPDTLHYIYMHLWPNAYKHDHTPFAKQQDRRGNTEFYYSKAKDRGYIDSLQFTINGNPVDYNSTDDIPDIARIDLAEPLLPGKQMKITTPFRVKIPKVFSRMGHTKQAYYISQWFPKPAVYDRKGWHPISYLDQGEFYSEFGSYDVNITLPENYVVMATGNCTDETENRWLDELAKKPLPADTLYVHGWPASSDRMKTLHYHEENVHDFAWFADKRWVVRKDTVTSPGNGLVVTTWTAFLPIHKKYWQHATDYLRETVKHYGKWVGPYQYKTVKAVEGDMHAGGGMEYPTVTIIDRAATGPGLRSVVIHEAGHNWFYGMLGSMERDHAWMDEGINTFYEQKTSEELRKSDTTKAIVVKQKGRKADESLLYYQAVATHTDQAIDQTSDNFTNLNYGGDVYYKTAVMLRWLEDYMGQGFQDGMHEYFEYWHFRHPYPEDFRAVMQQHTTKNLDWFFDTVMHTDKRIDYKITRAYTKDAKPFVLVKNNTGVYAPVKADFYYHDSLVGSEWSTTPFSGDGAIFIPNTNWTSAQIDDVIPDGKATNDLYRRKAIFHHFGLKIKPFLGANESTSDKLFISPSLGYNENDGFMLGLLFHDLTIPENHFRFAVAPMYAFSSQTIVGAGSVGYIWYPENLFKEILLQGDAKTFDYDRMSPSAPQQLFARYIKAAPSLNFTFNEHNLLSPVTSTLTLKGYYITEEQLNHGDNVTPPALSAPQEHTYGLIKYTHRNARTYNPFSYSLEGQAGADFAKINLEGNVRIDYNTKNKSLYVRGYLGKFFAINNDPSVASRYYLNASYTGLDDYLYDGTYLGRSNPNSLGAQQVSMQEGGFKVPTYNNVDRSDNWMAAVNLKTDLPFGKLPIQLFLDGGLIPNANPSPTDASSSKFIYDAGVEIHIYKDFFQLYLPVLMSKDFQNYLDNTYGKKNAFARSISFSINLQGINWLKAPEGALRMFTK